MIEIVGIQWGTAGLSVKSQDFEIVKVCLAVRLVDAERVVNFNRF